MFVVVVVGILVLAYFAVGLWALGRFIDDYNDNFFAFVLGIVAFFGLPIFLVEPGAILLPIGMTIVMLFCFYLTGWLHAIMGSAFSAHT